MFQVIKYLAVIICLTLASLVAQAQTIDINTATAAELETLKGIGPSKAAAIIQYRTEHGAFQSVDDLVKVPGVGPKTLGDVKDKISVGGATGTGLPKASGALPITPGTVPAAPMTKPAMPATKPAVPSAPPAPMTAPAKPQ